MRANPGTEWAGLSSQRRVSEVLAKAPRRASMLFRDAVSVSMDLCMKCKGLELGCASDQDDTQSCEAAGLAKLRFM